MEKEIILIFIYTIIFYLNFEMTIDAFFADLLQLFKLPLFSFFYNTFNTDNVHSPSAFFFF